jgi:diacylglycerol kinase family enzyme
VPAHLVHRRSPSLRRPDTALREATVADSICVLVNPRSGDAQTDTAAIADAFARHGMPVRVQPLAGGEADAAVLDAVAGDPLVVAGGGDGTLATVAARLREGAGTLGVLPLGTRNHFGRDLGIPLELDEAVAAIATGATRAVDLGEVGGHVFLNNASLGAYTQFVLCREGERRRPRWALWPTLIKAAWRALRTSRDLDLELVVDGERLRRRTPVLLVGNNVYDLQGLDRGQRPRLDAGVLSVTVLRPRSRAGLVWFGLRALVGAVSAEHDFEQLATDALVVNARDGGLDVALDGEPRRLALPLHFRSLPGALRVRDRLRGEAA